MSFVLLAKAGIRYQLIEVTVVRAGLVGLPADRPVTPPGGTLERRLA